MKQEAFAVLQARSNSCGVKKLSNLGCILKVKPTGFVGIRERENPGVTPGFCSKQLG